MGAIRAIGIGLSLIAICLTVYSLISPFWATNIQNNSGFQSMETKALGLFKYCVKGSSSPNYNCQKLSQLGVAKLAQMGIVGMRCLMIIGLIAGFAGFFAGVASSDAVNVAKSAGDKNKAAGGAAGCFTVAGATVLIATSWSAHKIIKKYSMIMGGSLNSAGTQWTLGAGIYTGWVAAFIFIGVAVIMFMGCCSSSEEDQYEEDTYQPAHPHGYAESGYSQGKKEFV